MTAVRKHGLGAARFGAARQIGAGQRVAEQRAPGARPVAAGLGCETGLSAVRRLLRTGAMGRRLLSGRRLLAGCVLSGGLVASALGCGGSTPVRAASDWDRSVDLEPTKTFSIARSKLLPPNLTPQQEALVGVIESTTRRELVKKGYVEAPTANAQLIATSHFLARQRLGVTTYTCENYWQHEMYEGAVLPAGAVPPCQDSAISEFQEGVLIIDFYDVGRKELVWHGWAAGRRPEQGSSETAQLVERATVDILDRFPP